MNRTSLGSTLTEKVFGLEGGWSALGFEMSPALQAVQDLVATSVEPYLELNNRLAEIVHDIVVPSDQLASLVANPVIKQVTPPLQKMVEEIGRSAAAQFTASIEMPNLSEVLGIEASIGTALEEARAAVERLAIRSLPDLTLRWERLLPQLPQLPELKIAVAMMEAESGGRLEVVLPATNKTRASVPFTRDEWILIARVSLSLFVLAHLAFPPEWRRYLGDHFGFLYAFAMAWVFALSKDA